MLFPEYTVSLLIWILPIIASTIFFIHQKLLSPEKIFALLVTITGMATVGILLDLFFACNFFVFPNPQAVLGITIRNIPIEEFIFYITGFWFIIFMYVFCDEWFLKKYNVSDKKYARFRARLKKKLFVNLKGSYWILLIVVFGFFIKWKLNPGGGIIPGYFIFLLCVAYFPFILFSRVTKSFVNWPAFVFSLVITLLISIIWEVTLALPRGYWGYQDGQMLGIFLQAWNRLPLEAVTVWIFCTLVILMYEYVKICYFTKVPSVPGYNILLKVGKKAHT